MKKEPFTNEEELKHSKGKLKLNYYVEKLNLNSLETDKAFKLLAKYNIYKTSSKDSLKNFKAMNPKKWFILEKRSNGDYYKLQYDDPENSKENQVQEFLLFYSELENRIHLKNKFMDFEFKVGPGSFTAFCEKDKYVYVITY